MQRDSEDYKKFQLAWTLSQTEEWKKYLKPLLEYYAGKKVPNITSQDSAFKAAYEQGDIDRATKILTSVEYDAKKFTEIKITI